MRKWTILLLLAFTLQAETVDRLAIAVGHTVVTELQIDEDLRVSALLNQEPVGRDMEARRAAADRLVEQLLIQHEIEISRYPAPSEVELNAYYYSIEQTLGGEERMKALLAQYNISDAVLRTHLLQQLATLRFVEFRFRPDVSISDVEIEIAYQRQVAALRTADPNQQLPPLDAEQRKKLTEMLVEERTDAALNSWLAETRKQVDIRYIDTDLR